MNMLVVLAEQDASTHPEERLQVLWNSIASPSNRGSLFIVDM